MDSYTELNDQEKFDYFPDEFIQELRRQFQSGDIDEAIDRAHDFDIDVSQIIS